MTEATLAPPIPVPEEDPPKTTQRVKNPKKVAAGRAGAAARKRNAEALRAELLRAKAALADEVAGRKSGEEAPPPPPPASPVKNNTEHRAAGQPQAFDYRLGLAAAAAAVAIWFAARQPSVPAQVSSQAAPQPKGPPPRATQPPGRDVFDL